MPAAHKILRLGGPTLFLVCGLFPILVASEPMWLLRGSDAGGCCLQPSLWAQLLAWGGTAGALYWRVLAPRGAAQVAYLVTATCAYLLSLHGICHSVDREGVFEHWAGMRLRALPLDPSDGELKLDASWFFIDVHADGQRLRVLRGIPPWLIPEPGPLACEN